MPFALDVSSIGTGCSVPGGGEEDPVMVAEGGDVAVVFLDDLRGLGDAGCVGQGGEGEGVDADLGV